ARRAVDLVVADRLDRRRPEIDRRERADGARSRDDGAEGRAVLGYRVAREAALARPVVLPGRVRRDAAVERRGRSQLGGGPGVGEDRAVGAALDVDLVDAGLLDGPVVDGPAEVGVRDVPLLLGGDVSDPSR